MKKLRPAAIYALKTVLFFIAVLILIGGIVYCLAGSDADRERAEANREREWNHQADIEGSRLINQIKYYKDDRTKLCFIATGVGGYGQAVSYVPCTEEVEKLLFKNSGL